MYARGTTSVYLLEKGAVKLNTTATNGGGVFNGPSSTEEEQGGVKMGGSSLVSGNIAHGNGGGVYNEGAGSHLVLDEKAAIKSNEAAVHGGGIFNGQSRARPSHSAPGGRAPSAATYPTTSSTGSSAP